MNERVLNDIELLATLFSQGGWKELRLKAEGFELLLSLDPDSDFDDAPVAGSHPEVPSPSRAPAVKAQATLPQATPELAPAETAASDPAYDAADTAWHPVVAPNLGTFYRSPKPGSPPYVELGQQVDAGTEVCLLEVMKLFTSVNAGVSGKIARICAADAELVHGGQVLYYIEQD